MSLLLALLFLNPATTLRRFAPYEANNRFASESRHRTLCRSRRTEMPGREEWELTRNGRGRALSRYHRLGIWRCLRHHLVGLGHTDHFFDRGNPLPNAAPTIMTQRLHSLRNSALLQLAAVSFLQNQPTQRLGHHANFVDSNPALISSLP